MVKGGSSSNGRGRRSRPRWFAAGLGAVVLLSVAAALAASGERSPEQAAADARAPSPSVITVPVERRVLAEEVVTRGDVVAQGSVSVPSPSLPPGSLPVVTQLLVKAGQRVALGAALLAVAGRPVLILQGAIPAYRTMAPGDDGVDIRQLQRSLVALGYGMGADSFGTYGRGTEEAVRSLYKAAGFDVALTSPTADSDLAGAETAVATAKEQLRAAEVAARTTTTTTPQAATGVSSGAAGVSSGAASNVQEAGAALVAAQARLAALQATTGAQVPLGEAVFVPSLPATVSQVSIGLGQQAPGHGALVVLGGGAAEVRASVNQSQLPLIHPGEDAQLADDSTGAGWAARVASVGPVSSTTNGDSSTSAPSAAVIVVSTPPTAIPLAEIGRNVRVTMTKATTAGPVLVVPVAAVFTTADGRSQVTTYVKGLERNVQVELGLDVAGNVQVTPKGGGLSEGTPVIVGTRSAG